MTAVLELKNVQKWVGVGKARIDILRGVSMRVEQGEFLAIMGASGSGKSTLLNMIGLLDSPSAGTLSMGGHEASRLSEKDLAQLRARTIGFIFQSFNLLSYMTALQNVQLPMGYMQREDTQERSLKLLARVRLNHRAHAYPTTLSGGEKQRVAIARSLANEPMLLLADEPTGALDSKTGEEIMQLLRELHAQGATILVVTHDANVAHNAQRVLRMKDGRFE